MTQDSAQSPRLGQRLPAEGGAKVPFVTTLTLPPAAWPGMMVYNGETEQLMIFDGNEGAWIVPGASGGGNLTFVSADEPAADNIGDWWVDISDEDNPVLKYWDGADWITYVDPQAAAAGATAAQALADALAASELAGTKIKTFHQTNEPSSDMTAGDLWFDTDDGNKLYRRQRGGVWEGVRGTWGIENNRAYMSASGGSLNSRVMDVRTGDCIVEVTIPVMGGSGYSGLQLRSDGTNGPNAGYSIYNSFVWDEGTDTQVPGAYSNDLAATDRCRAVMDGDTITLYRQVAALGAWTQIFQFTDSTYQANTKHGLFVWAATGIAARFDDFLITDLDGRVLASDTFNRSDDAASIGSASFDWIVVHDKDIADAQLTADTALATADGKITTFYDPDPPTGEGESVGDLWFRDLDNKAFRYSGTEWVAIQDVEIAQALQDAGTAAAIADGKIQTYYSPEEPTSPSVGDLWYDTDANNLLKRWSGSTWDEIPQPARAERIEGGTLYEQLTVAPGAGVTLEAGVANPATAPAITQIVQGSAWPSIPSGFTERGLDWDDQDDVFIRLLVPDDAAARDGGCRVQMITTTGVMIEDITLGNVPGMTLDDMHSVCRYSFWYVTMIRQIGSGWTLAFFAASDLTGDFSGQSPTWAWADTTKRPVVGRATGGTYPLITASYADGSGIESGYYAKFRQSDGSHGAWASPGGSNQTFDPDSDGMGGTHMTWVHWADLPGVETEIYLGGSTKARRYVYNGTEFVQDATWSLEFNANSSRGGLCLVPAGELADAGWYSVQDDGGSLYHYSDYVPAAGEKVWVTYTDNSGAQTTLDSPPASLAIKRGWYAQVTLPPSGTPTSKVYAGKGSVLPTDPNLKERPETLNGRVLVFDPSVAGGAGTPPPANTFVGTGQGVFRTFNDFVVINGDGSGDWIPLREKMSLQDTDWINLPYASGYDGTTVGQLKYRVRDGVVYLNGGGRRIAGNWPAGQNGTMHTISTSSIPAHLRPSHAVTGACRATAGRVGFWNVTTGGSVQITPERDSGGTDWVACDNASWPVAFANVE